MQNNILFWQWHVMSVLTAWCTHHDMRCLSLSLSCHGAEWPHRDIGCLLLSLSCHGPEWPHRDIGCLSLSLSCHGAEWPHRDIGCLLLSLPMAEWHTAYAYTSFSLTRHGQRRWKPLDVIMCAFCIFTYFSHKKCLKNALSGNQVTSQRVTLQSASSYYAL